MEILRELNVISIIIRVILAMVIGGIIGTSQSSGATYSNLKNFGTIASYGSNNGCRFFTGGIIGYCWKVGELSNSVNGVEGDATKGKIIIKGTVGTTIAANAAVYYPCIASLQVEIRTTTSEV